MRRATLYALSSTWTRSISIHALREEGDFQYCCVVYVFISISIHALREEGDAQHNTNDTLRTTISIHALREEGDVTISDKTVQIPISIHALREEGDDLRPETATEIRYFYPRPP